MKKILIALDNNVGAQKVAATGYELSKALACAYYFNACNNRCNLLFISQLFAYHGF